jgi:trehalose 6-phosphate synthase/phosphatase
MALSARLVIGSNRLPFCVKYEGDELQLQRTSGGLAAALESVHAAANSVWVGWPGDCSGLEDFQRAELSGALRGKRVVPVDLSDHELLEYYDGVCNAVLWPVLHSLIDRVPVTLPGFEAYRTVNERFAEKLAATYRDGDIVWIHDYHLMLAPAMVRACLPAARIGFFFHTPFPSADIFRVLPWCRELLDGVLGATLVGFQTRGDALNFAASARLLADYVVDDDRLVVDGRQVRIGAYPIGIDPARLQVADPPRAAPESLVTPVRYPGRQLLVGVDRLDYTKGIPNRLAAFEQLLSEEPQLHGRVEMFQLAVPTRGVLPTYVAHQRDVQRWVDRINERFGTPSWTPVRYVLQSASPVELRRIYDAADVMLVTSIRDGMNLVAKEFVSCREKEDGVLILSELAGAAEALDQALIVNPYSVEDLTRAIRTALTMNREEQRRRMRSLRRQVSGWTVHHWVDRFTGDLAAASQLSAVPAESSSALLDAILFEPQRLSLAFFYEEALVETHGALAAPYPDPALVNLLGGLATRTELDLHIISAVDHATLGRWFDTVPVTIWAEHGLWRRDRNERRWERTEALDADWTADLRQFLRQFTARTPGSFLEERTTGFAWHFGRMKTAEGRAQAQMLFGVLHDAAETMDFTVAFGPSLLEIRPGGLSKQRTIEKLLASDAGQRRLIVFEQPAEGATTRKALRPSDLLVSVGARADRGDHALADVRAVRKVLRSLMAPLAVAGVA